MDTERSFRGKAKTLHRTRGLVQDLIVTRQGATITLWSEGGIRHTVFDSAAPHLPGLEYARNMLAVLAFCPHAQSCLILGLGGGSIPRMLLAARPLIEVEAVEVDSAVVELAAKYFDIRALPRFRIHLRDAASFLRGCTSRYEIVVIDTYVGERFPDHCATADFVKDARKCLSDDGVLAVNWLGGDRQTQESLLKNLERTVGSVWQLPGMQSRNFLYFAPAKPTTRREITSTATTIGAEIPFEHSLGILIQHLRHRG